MAKDSSAVNGGLPLYRAASPYDNSDIQKINSRSHTPSKAQLSTLTPISNVHSRNASTSASASASTGHVNANTSGRLPRGDRAAFAVLVALYFIQGVPIGLAFGSIPFILKSFNLSYSQVGIFSLASYPYSFKLVYSPIVDSVFHKKFGRRKSWIIPVQFISGVTLIILSHSIDSLMSQIQESLWKLTLAFFILIFLCATQDIAVDGWALTILSPQALSFASTAQTVGLNCGYFLSFTVFLAFNSAEFANKYFRAIPKDHGLISLPQYLQICGVLYIVITILVAVFVPEQPRNVLGANVKRSDDIELMNPVEQSNNYYETDSGSTNGNGNTSNLAGTEFDSNSSIQNLYSVYRKMFQVLKLSDVQTFIILHLISKIGFQANDAATNLKLLEKGLAKEDLAITVLIDFPFEIVFGYYAGRWSSGDEPLKPWLLAFLGRIFAAFCGQILVWGFPANGEEVGMSYFIMVILQHLMGSFMSTVQFVSICAFHTKIADPLIGGTYMTTLNTLSNLGGQWPKLIVLYAIDNLTSAVCEPTSTTLDIGSTFENEPYYTCNSADLKKACQDAGGQCNIISDGYYYTNMICITIGLLTYFLWISKTAKYLQKLPKQNWRVFH